MPEKTITLEGVEPLAFYGVANANLNRICDLFPKLKIVARGSSIKAIGDEAELERFQEKMQALMAYSSKYGHISPEVVGQVFSEGLHKAEEAQSKDTIVYGNGGLIVKARTVNQQRLVELYDDNDLLFAVGPAGSGKTYTAIALAVRALRNKEVKRIILTRPAVEAGEKLGFLPGDLKEKLDPYLQPLYDALNDMIPAAKLQKYIDEGTVQIAPLAYMRGRTLDNAFVILDEAQNTTLSQLKMFLTRMGRNAKFIVTGDITQIDLPRRSDSGLVRAMELLRGIDGIGIVEFDQRDIIRHRLREGAGADGGQRDAGDGRSTLNRHTTPAQDAGIFQESAATRRIERDNRTVIRNNVNLSGNFIRFSRGLFTSLFRPNAARLCIEETQTGVCGFLNEIFIIFVSANCRANAYRACASDTPAVVTGIFAVPEAMTAGRREKR